MSPVPDMTVIQMGSEIVAQVREKREKILFKLCSYAFYIPDIAACGLSG
jgi:hypothetical protein